MLNSRTPGVLSAAVFDGPRQSFDREILAKLIATAFDSLDTDRATAEDCIQRAAGLLQVIRKERLAAEGANVVRGGLATWQRKQVATYVEANISANIRLKDLARVARLSKSHFCRAFRKSFGERPMAYVRKQRVRRGQELLQKSPTSLCEIAIACGLCDQSHFTRVFHRFVGMPPGLWRRQFANGPGVLRLASVGDARTFQPRPHSRMRRASEGLG